LVASNLTGIKRMSERTSVLRRAGRDDLAFIMTTERRPGFELMVGRWSRDAHLRCLTAPSYAYLIGARADGEPAGFAILRDLDDPHGNVCLKRIAVAEPGRGFGGAFLGGVVDWAFHQTEAHRVWLDVLADNARARHVYSTHGMNEEGRLRGAYQLPDGGRVDLVVMSLTRPEWAARASSRAR
jgi:RimJ/RimL family protein N-acetyltransferase